MSHKCSCCTKEHEHDKKHEKQGWKLEVVLYIISIVIFILSFINIHPYSKIILYIATILLSGYELIINGIKNILKLNFTEDTLMTIAVIAAFALGEFPESCLVVLLYKIGEVIEDRVVSKSEKNIEDISKIKAQTANILDENDNAKIINAEILKVGDRIIIKPGEKVPVDCIVLSGTSNLDTSAITGESNPVSITKDNNILSGSINLTGAVIAKVEKNMKNSTASQIVDLVYQAVNNKGETEKFITKFSKIYTPIVILIAIIVATIPPLIGILDFKTWITRSLIFLVASCPCSIVISIPLAFIASVGTMSKKGLLIKGTKHIENLATARSIAFDKTGTLTTGKMQVDKIEIIAQMEKEQVLDYIVNMEKLSNHPISKAIIDIKPHANKLDITDHKEIAGHGLYAKIDQKEILLGNRKLLKQYKIDIKEEYIGNSYLVIDKELIAYIILKEKINDSNKKIVSELNKNGIKRVVMLTGDNQKAAEKIGNELKITEIYSELLPQDKQTKIKEIKKDGKVIFVGDGINDSPVLAESDFGISMGMGTEIANNMSDSILMSNNIYILPKCIYIAKKTMKIVKENITFSLLAKLIVLILGIVGIAPIWLAILVDTGMSMLTVLNSVRIYKQ